jgi:hypothetical protein
VEQQSDGKWYTKYVLGPIFTGNEEMTAEQQEAEYKTRRDAEQAVSIRTQRNQKLAETDWTQVADAPVDKQAWATYRQVLRDVPTQTGFPWNTQWPNKPE